MSLRDAINASLLIELEGEPSEILPAFAEQITELLAEAEPNGPYETAVYTLRATP